MEKKPINFSSNWFTFLSHEVIVAIEESKMLYENHKAISFGIDNKILAETELARNFIADSLRVNSHEVFFGHGNASADIEIINSAILFLKIDTIITTKFENTGKLKYLNSLSKNGSIKLEYIETSIYGELNISDLKEKITRNHSSTLVSFSHINQYTGIFIPTKEISSICKSNSCYFHLDIQLSVGRFDLNFLYVEPDFITFDSGLLKGPIDIGVVILKNNPLINNQEYIGIKKVFSIAENKNLMMISGFLCAFEKTFRNREKHCVKIAELKEYAIIQMHAQLNLKPFIPENKKSGNYPLIPYIIEHQIYGKYFIEKLDLKRIQIYKTDYPHEFIDNSNQSVIGLAINEELSEMDIDLFIELMKDFKMRNK